MTRKLTKLRINEVSLVDRGASPGARVLLYKRDDARPFGKGDDHMDLVAVAKRVVAGEPTAFVEKRDFYAAIESGAAEIRKADEPPEQAFARFCETDPRGQILLKAHKMAKGADHRPEPEPEPVVPQSIAYAKLCRKAEKARRKDPSLSEAAAFAKVYANPKNRDLVEADRAANRGRWHAADMNSGAVFTPETHAERVATPVPPRRRIKLCWSWRTRSRKASPRSPKNKHSLRRWPRARAKSSIVNTGPK
jgi:hypothetical protein